MKLWQKIFLWTLLIVMTAISSIEILLLKNNFRETIKEQTENCISRHAYMVSNINNKILTERLQRNSILLSRIDVIETIQEIFDNSGTNASTVVAIFSNNNQMLYTNSSLKLDSTLLEKVISDSSAEGETNRSLGSSDTKYYTQILKLDKKMRLFVASPVVLEQQQFIFVSSDDITDVFHSYSGQLKYAKFICILLSLVCSIILLVLVKFLLRPLENLNRTTHAIASGNYRQRVDIHTHDELGMLAENMNIMANSVEENVTQLQEVAENRKTFINNLTHEMKTPLTSILGFADILRIKRNISSEELSEYSGIIFEEARHLKNLSGKLMELITIGETNPDFTPIETAPLFSQIELLLQPIIQNHHLTLSVHCDNCVISADATLFQSMIMNFIDNAIKASAPGDEIILDGTEKKGFFCIRVTDSGIGIPKEELLKITEPFYMIDKARSRKAGGAGLGLALCKRIAEIHHADFKIESEPGHGTTINLTISAKPPTDEP